MHGFKFQNNYPDTDLAYLSRSHLACLSRMFVVKGQHQTDMVYSRNYYKIILHDGLLDMVSSFAYS